MFSKMKVASSEESKGVQSKQQTDYLISPEVLLMQPWKFWGQKDEYETLLRSNLLDAFKAAVELRRRKVYIKDEVNKKRSRLSAAVKRAFAASRRDASHFRESIVQLGLEDLWACLERENASGIKQLNERLESTLSSPPDHILKEEYQTLITEPQEALNNIHLKSHATNLHEKVGAESQDESSEEDEDEEYADVSRDQYAGDSEYDDKKDEEERMEGELYADGDESQEDSADDQDDAADEEEQHLGDDEDKNYGSGLAEAGAVEETSKMSVKSLNDGFFSMNAMEEFADRDFEEGDDGFNYFESMGEESDASKAADTMMYGDFFDDQDGDDNDETSDEDEPLDCPRGLEGLDEDEREMELLLQKVEKEEYSDEEEPDRDGEEMMNLEHMNGMRFEEEEEGKADQVTNIKRGKEADDEISRVEKELISQKHWSLMGEASGRKRPRNSLLDLDLELPQNSSFIHVNKDDVEQEDEQDEDTVVQVETQDIPTEIIIQQRIKAEVFDNVERKIPLEDQLDAIERLKQRRNRMDRENPEIDFHKSKMGLGEVYAQRYQEMFMATDKLDEHKKKLTDDFGTLMFKLDSLCNYTMVPKRTSEAEKAKDVSLITVEAPINVVTASRHTDAVDEKMEGNKITRNAKKRKFTNKLKGLLKSGKATIEDIKRIKEKAIQRNKKKVQDAKDIKLTGLTKEQQSREKKRSNRRINISELMSKNQ